MPDRDLPTAIVASRCLFHCTEAQKVYPGVKRKTISIRHRYVSAAKSASISAPSTAPPRRARLAILSSSPRRSRVAQQPPDPSPGRLLRYDLETTPPASADSPESVREINATALVYQYCRGHSPLDTAALTQPYIHGKHTSRKQGCCCQCCLALAPPLTALLSTKWNGRVRDRAAERYHIIAQAPHPTIPKHLQPCAIINCLQTSFVILVLKTLRHDIHSWRLPRSQKIITRF